MIQTLNMDLEVVRTVLKNEGTEISVCRDRKRDSGVFYTVISVQDPEIRKELARRMAENHLFDSNSDFIGTFTFRGSFNLVFTYQPENRFSAREEEWCRSFADRKKLAESYLVACAEIGITGGIGELILEESNINLSPTGEVYFNYFLNFDKLRDWDNEGNFYRTIGTRVYDILSGGYKVQLDGDFERYPSEIQLFYRKTEAKSFASINHLLTFVRELPDEPEEQVTGFRRQLKRLEGGIGWIQQHSSTLFLLTLVLITIVFAVYQIAIRIRAGKNAEKILEFVGLTTIGEVYLGDEAL